MQFSSTEDFWNVTRPIGRARIKVFLLHLRMYRTTILRFKFAFTFLLFDLFSSNYECTSYCTKILFDPISSTCTLLCIARYCIWGFRNFDSSLCTTFYTTLLPDEQLVQNIAFLDRPKNFRLQSFHVEVRLMRLSLAGRPACVLQDSEYWSSDHLRRPFVALNDPS